MITEIETKANGTVSIKESSNPRSPYEHQEEAIRNLNIIDKLDSYSTLVVLPTGGGKTYTASTWLLKNAVDKGKKLLWLAHQQTLLDQAADSFIEYAYRSTTPHIDSFNYRIISGAKNHDRLIDVKPTDDILIVSKGSAKKKNLYRLDNWLEGEDTIYFVIDEAHHSTAKGYRDVMDYLKEKVRNLKIIGLTATPTRTSENEKGLLAKIYQDGIENGQVVRGNIGMAFKVDLTTLINRRILSKPVFESFYTGEKYGENLGLKALESIEHRDELPPDIKEQIAKSAARNKVIVDTYLKNKEKYGQTIVFAVNKLHAEELSGVFKSVGIAADFVVSDLRDKSGKITVSREDNERKMKAFRDGKLQVLINVKILTEGVDFPQTKTVFLARPTVSTILMTQMIGRALRGEKAGGTSLAYIVPFIDNWNEHIAWANPETLFFDETGEFKDTSTKEREQQYIRLISIAKIEEFAAILNGGIEAEKLESVPFVKRMPIGMYSFTYLEEDDGADIFYQVMVYDSTSLAYEKLMQSLPELFDIFGVGDDEYLQEDVLLKMERRCREAFFLGEMIPSYQPRDIKHVLQYYAQKRSVPDFYTFEEIDKSRLDPTFIAQKIWDEDMGARKRSEYLKGLWNNEDDNILRLFFRNELYFLREVDIAFEKISHPQLFAEKTKVKYGRKKLEELPLHEIGKYDEELEKSLHDGAFEKAKTTNGKYKCALCGKESASRIAFEVDHIVAMNNGGLSVPENLQILCTSCNRKKGDA